MTYTTLQKPHFRPIDAEISKLHPKLEFDVSPEPFRILISEGGVSHAEDAIFSSLEQIAHGLENAVQDWHASQLPNLSSIASEVYAIADKMGFNSVKVAARYLLLALETNNHVAIGATLGRLERSFEALVTKIWDYFDEI